MRVLDLFSGIGGFSLGLERAGMETVAFCEFDPKARLVLKKHWPDVPIYKDVKELTYDRLKEDGILADAYGSGAGEQTKNVQQGKQEKAERKERFRNVLEPGRTSTQTGESYNGSRTIDLICGGFPCQPFSTAGKQGGFEDDRDLWPEYFRLVQEVGPAWIIGENVAGFIGMGLERTISDLEGAGYGVQTFTVPACAVGAPHQRTRVWIIAHAERRGGRVYPGALAGEEREIQAGGKQFQSGPEAGNGGTGSEDVADSGINAKRPDAGPGSDREMYGQQDHGNQARNDSGNGGELLPDANETGRGERRGAEPVQPGRNTPECDSERTGGHWAVEPSVGRVAHGVSKRVDRLKQLGNAVVPQVVEMIGRSIMEAENDSLSRM